MNISKNYVRQINISRFPSSALLADFANPANPSCAHESTSPTRLTPPSDPRKCWKLRGCVGATPTKSICHVDSPGTSTEPISATDFRENREFAGGGKPTSPAANPASAAHRDGSKNDLWYPYPRKKSRRWWGLYPFAGICILKSADFAKSARSPRYQSRPAPLPKFACKCS